MNDFLSLDLLGSSNQPVPPQHNPQAGQGQGQFSFDEILGTPSSGQNPNSSKPAPTPGDLAFLI
jgi:hypothetical protein